MRILRFNVGPLDNNTYLMVDESTREAAIVDPSFDSAGVWDRVEQDGLTLVRVLNTHAHIDHVVENALFVERSGAPLALHPADLPLLHAMSEQAAWMGVPPPRPAEPTHALCHGESIRIGGEAVTVAHTPGHSPGSVSFVGDGFVLSGDALFAGSIGRTDLPGGDLTQLLRSIHGRLLTLPDATIVYPGHGHETTIGRERRSNLFLQGTHERDDAD